MQFRGPRHVSKHVIKDASRRTAKGEASGGVAGGIVMEIGPCFAAVGAAEDAFAAVHSDGEA